MTSGPAHIPGSDSALATGSARPQGEDRGWHPHFPAHCAQVAGLDLDDPSIVVDQRGNRHVVLLDTRRDLAYRFPRQPADSAALLDRAQRHQCAQDLGLPVPALLDVVVDPRHGQSFMVVRRIRGVSLDDPGTRASRSQISDRLASELVELCEQLARVEPTSWTPEQPQWGDIWADFAATAATRLPRLAHTHGNGGIDNDFIDAATAVTQRAAESARIVSLGLSHGDIGGVNTRVDLDTGAITGVIDWDGAVIGDPASDVVALLAGAPSPVTARMIDISPGLAQVQDHYDAYLHTWPLQGLLWASEVHDDALLGQLVSECRRTWGLAP